MEEIRYLKRCGRMFYCWVKQQNDDNNGGCDWKMPIKAENIIYHTVGLGFMLIPGLQGQLSGPKHSIQPDIAPKWKLLKETKNYLDTHSSHRKARR